MFSNLLNKWSLQRRLVVGVLVLLALLSVVFGAVSTVALHQALSGQLDRQLLAAHDRARGGGPGRGPSPGPATTVFPAGQGPGTIKAVIFDGTVIAADVLSPPSTPLPTDTYATLQSVPTDGRPHTETIPNLGSYRLVATSNTFTSPLSSAQHTETTITGLPLSTVEETVRQVLVVEAIVAGTGLLLAGLAGAFIVRLSLRPLGRVVATARRVSELPLSKGEVDLSVRVPDSDTDPRTEVGQVGAALNRMLGHIEDALAVRHASETRVRQFVADASHELRTPLAAIRGYAELTRRDRDNVPEDVAHALRRIESEGDRMTTLVDDLLLLARLDSGRPLDQEPVELSGLVVDAVNDAHASSRDHRWLLDLPEDAVTVTGDSARLHQVLANLLANARVHTPPGTIVTTGLSVKDGWATVTVTDNGPGIPEPLRPDIFERFARGDTSRSRAAGSTGLGLAIVAAVVETHGGRVEVSSEPGRTAFRVHLPNATLTPE